MKKVILAALVSGVMTSTAFAAPIDAGQGTVTFTGSIITAACGIAPESTDQTVNLGQVASSQLTDGGTSRPQTFTIELVDCDISALTDGTATVTFTGGLDSNFTNNDGLVIQGQASGAAVRIIGVNGLPVKLDRSANSGTTIHLQDNDNSLLFSAYLQGYSGATAAPVVPGEFTALANFTMEYN